MFNIESHRRPIAINTLAPNCQYNSEPDGTILEWLTPDIPQPSEAEIDAEVIRLTEEYDAQEYARKREAEYPSIVDLVVALYDTDDKSAVEAKRAAVKLKYPKP